MIISKETIFNKIEEIKNDTTRKWMQDLAEMLIDYSFQLWERKSKLVDVKLNIEKQWLVLKKKIRETAEKKMTLDEIDMAMKEDFDYRDLLQEKAHQEKEIQEADVVLKSIYEFINVIKFLDRDTIKAEKVFNQWYN